jgi:hypothetical protein
MLTDVYTASRREMQGKFDDLHEESYTKVERCTAMHFPIGRTFDRHQNNIRGKQQSI